MRPRCVFRGPSVRCLRAGPNLSLKTNRHRFLSGAPLSRDTGRAMCRVSPRARVAASHPQAAGLHACDLAAAAGVKMHMAAAIGDHRSSGMRAQPREHGGALPRVRHEVHRAAIAMHRWPAGAGDDCAGSARGDDLDGTETSLELRQHGAGCAVRQVREALPRPPAGSATANGPNGAKVLAAAPRDNCRTCFRLWQARAKGPWTMQLSAQKWYAYTTRFRICCGKWYAVRKQNGRNEIGFRAGAGAGGRRGRRNARAEVFCDPHAPGTPAR